MAKIAIINPIVKYFDRMSTNFIMPRYGTIAIATALKNAGHEVRAFSEFIRVEIDWQYVYEADYICFAVMTFSANRAYQLAKQIKSKKDVPIIFGGAHPTVLPGECLDFCDYVVRNEGEETIIQLIEGLENGSDVTGLRGISYRDNKGKDVHNENRAFMEDIDVPQDVSLMHDYDAVGERFYGKYAARHYMQVVQTSRGCPYNCKFCVAPKELGLKYRTKSIDVVLKDLANGVAYTKSPFFLLVDNEFTVKKIRTKALLKAIAEKFDDSLYLMVFARNEVGSEPEILELMYKAGVRLLFIGVESVNEETLKYFNKNQTLEKVANNVARIHDAGISTIGSTILGSDYDKPEYIRESSGFFISNGFAHAHFYSLYEIPTKQKILNLPQLFEDYRFIHHDWRFYTSGFVIHFPKYMKPSTLQKIIIENYRHFYSAENRSAEKDALAGTPYSRLGFWLRMVVPEIRIQKKYISLLEEFEEGLYNQNEHLIESKLLDKWKNKPMIRDVSIDLTDMEGNLF